MKKKSNPGSGIQRRAVNGKGSFNEDSFVQDSTDGNRRVKRSGRGFPGGWSGKGRRNGIDSSTSLFTI